MLYCFCVKCQEKVILISIQIALAKDPVSFLYRICRTDDKDYLDSHKVNSYDISNIETLLRLIYALLFLFL